MSVGAGVHPVELVVLSSNGMHPVLHALVPDFERTTGHRVTVEYATANEIVTRIGKGETADLAIVTAPAMEQLARQGTIASASVRRLSQSGVGIAVRAGAVKPDIGTVDALKRALLNARSIAFTATGASGIYFAKLIDHLGITAEVNAKAIKPSGGLVGDLVAQGTAELAVQQIPELMTVKGIELAGPLPAPVQNMTVLAAGVFTASRNADAAAALIRYLSTPAAAAAYRESGVEPL